jgi:hypothetical protein
MNFAKERAVKHTDLENQGTINKWSINHERIVVSVFCTHASGDFARLIKNAKSLHPSHISTGQ